MNVLRNTSIKNKIIMIVMLVCSLITGLGFSIIIVSNVNNMKDDALKRTSMSAKLIGETCATSLSFKYPERAEEVLDKLKSIQEIISCYIYDDDSKLFASYNKAGEIPVAPFVKKETFHNFEGDYLHVYEPIVFMGNKHGAIYIKIYTSLTQKIRDHIIVMLSLMFGLLILSYLFANALQKIISGPILNLARTTEIVSEKKDYSIQANKESEDEIGKLIDSFNDMLSQIQYRDNALRESEERFRAAFDSAQDCVLIWDKDYNYLYANQAAIDHVGTTPDKVIGKNIRDGLGHVPDFMRLWMSRVDKVFEIGERLRVQDDQEMQGRLYHTDSILSPIRDTESNVISVCVVYRDITEHKQAEDKIKASLKEKEVLLREIHHRVKNNLQVIISLLRLQSGKIKDKQYAKMLQESQERIKSMALIHEKLYQSEDLAHIDFRGYVKSLVNSLSRSYGVSSNKVRIRIDVEDIPLGLDNAIPTGMILNELVSNSLKYAFPEGRKGEINVIISSTGEQDVELTVSDNGIGIPEDLDIRNSDSLGLHLVTILTEHQLQGKLEIDRTDGAEFNIRFKMKPDKAGI